MRFLNLFLKTHASDRPITAKYGTVCNVYLVSSLSWRIWRVNCACPAKLPVCFVYNLFDGHCLIYKNPYYNLLSFIMEENMQSLASKVALITGASSGIGAGTAVHFAKLKCKLSLTGRNEENLKKVVEDCMRAGAKAEDISTVIGDISKPEDIKRILKSTIDTFGRLDILVNNAGILIPGSVESTPLETFDLTMNINIRAMFLMTQLAIPHLKKTKGRIVNVSSITGIRSFPGIAAYCISKAAVDQLTRCTALEVASDGIRVNSVNPGVVVTEVHKRGGMSEEDYAKFLEKGKETHPLGRVGTVDEVAKSIAFLASDSSSFITGVNLPVDGGRGAMCPR